MIAIRSVFDPDPRCGCEPHGAAAAPIVMAEVMRKSRRFIVVLCPAPKASSKGHTRRPPQRVSREFTAGVLSARARCAVRAQILVTHTGSAGEGPDLRGNHRPDRLHSGSEWN